VYQEDDERFFVSVGLSLTEAWVHINSGLEGDHRGAPHPADDPTRPPLVVQPASRTWSTTSPTPPTSDDGDRFVILTNADGAVNSSSSAPLRRARPSPLGRPRTASARREARGISAFAGHLVRYDAGGIRRIVVMPHGGAPDGSW